MKQRAADESAASRDELLEIQRQFAATLGSTAAVEESLKAALGILVGLSGIDGAALYVADEQAGRLALIAQQRHAAAFVQHALEHPLGLDEGLSFVHRLPLAWSEPDSPPPLVDASSFRHAVLLPVCCGGEPVGCLVVLSRGPGAFRHPVLTALDACAGQLGGVLLRARSETALRASEATHRQLYQLVRMMCDNVPDLIWAKDLNRNYLFANQAICRKLLCARDTDEPVGRNDMYFANREREAHPDNPAWHTFGEVCVDSDDIVQAERRARRFDEYGTVHGEFLYLDVYKAPFFDDQGRLIGTVGCGRDVTRERRIEQELRQSAEQMRYLVQNMPAMIVAFDPAGQLLAWNKECERVTGYGGREMVGSAVGIERLIPPEPDQRRIVPELRHPGRIYRDLEGEIVCRDGTRRTIAWSNIAREFPVPGWYCWCIGIDVTGRKHAESERRHFERRLQRARKLESLGVLAGGIAHDFNNMLTSILGHSELALIELDEGSPLRDHLHQIGRAAERASELTRQLLAYAGRGEFVPERLDLSRLVFESRRRLEASVPDTCTLNVQVPAKGPQCDADSALVRQALVNLVTNAAEAIGGRPGTITIRSGVVRFEGEPDRLVFGEVTPGREYALLEVEDDGCGMAPDVRQRMFDPFFTTKRDGRGLGLAAVLGVARSAAGAIQVESVPGQGTRFALLLPADLDVGREQDERGEAEGWSGHGTVLIVDDEETVRHLARRMLEKLGFAVVEAANGRQGVEEFRAAAGAIHAVLLDLTMPEMDGGEALRQMRLVDPNIPVLLTSGYNEPDALARFGAQSWAGFLHKPFRLEQLAQALRRVLCDS